STVRWAATSAWPITWPPKTRCQPTLWLRPRYRLCSSCSRSSMSRSSCMACVIWSVPGIESHPGFDSSGEQVKRGRVLRMKRKGSAMLARPKKDDDARLDVIVAGAGYVGLAVAVSVAQASPHLAIAVVDAAPAGVWQKDGRASAIAAAAT